MAGDAPPADQAADLMQKLSLDSEGKTFEIPDATKKPSADSADITDGVQLDRSTTPLIRDSMDPAVRHLPNAHPAYYYGGFEGNEWEDYRRYMNPEGMELNSGAYGDNGSLMYHHGYGYTAYGQHYQYTTHYFQSFRPTSGPYPTPAATGKGETATSVAADKVPKPKSNGVASKGDNVKVSRPTYQNPSSNANGSRGRCALAGGIPASVYQDPRLHPPVLRTDIPYVVDAHPRPVTSSSTTSAVGCGDNVPSSRNHNYRPHAMVYDNHPRTLPTMNTVNGYVNQMYGNAHIPGMHYGCNGCGIQTGERGWMAAGSKYKPRGRGNAFYGYGNEDMDGLNELNRGPRTKSTKNLKGFAPVALAVKGQDIPSTGTADDEKSSVIPERGQYNRPDFPVSYPDAYFFVIKSYSEDDVHKSIKYNIWSSTPNGNKKLDAAYQSAQQKPGSCPVFLFFSVNNSGQFLGVAEMVGPVDFNKNVDYWQQDKWIGCFPVKWHIVKDVPNYILKHITLENNENKPVTHSRDTQEVKMEQGLEVLKIFKDHVNKQCILKDFDFYDDRQKNIMEKKARQQNFWKQTQVWEGKPTEASNKDSNENVNADVKPPQVDKETTPDDGNTKVTETSG